MCCHAVFADDIIRILEKIPNTDRTSHTQSECSLLAVSPCTDGTSHTVSECSLLVVPPCSLPRPAGGFRGRHGGIRQP